MPAARACPTGSPCGPAVSERRPDAVARPPDRPPSASLLGRGRGARLDARAVRRRQQRRRRRDRGRRPTGRSSPSTSAGTAGLHRLDEPSGLATFGAGTLGPALEAALEPHGLTLGHYPQSFEGSTIGGWVGDPLGRPAGARLRPDRRAVRRRPPRDAARPAGPAAVPRRRRPARTCARSSSAPRAGSGS